MAISVGDKLTYFSYIDVRDQRAVARKVHQQRATS